MRKEVFSYLKIMIVLTATMFSHALLADSPVQQPVAPSPVELEISEDQSTATLTIFDERAEALFGFLEEAQSFQEVIDDIQWTSRIGRGIACFKGEAQGETSSVIYSSPIYYCMQHILKTGKTIPGEIDPMIGVGNRN